MSILKQVPKYNKRLTGYEIKQYFRQWKLNGIANVCAYCAAICATKHFISGENEKKRKVIFDGKKATAPVKDGRRGKGEG